MNKYIKTTLKILASLILLILVGIGGLIVYAKYFYNQDVDITQYYADELPIKKEAFEKEFEEIHQHSRKSSRKSIRLHWKTIPCINRNG